MGTTKEHSQKTKNFCLSLTMTLYVTTCEDGQCLESEPRVRAGHLDNPPNVSGDRTSDYPQFLSQDQSEDRGKEA